MIGSNYYDHTVHYFDLRTGEESDITVGLFMDRLFDDLMFRMTKNPLVVVESLAEVGMTSVDKNYIANARAIRAFLRKIVDGKK